MYAGTVLLALGRMRSHALTCDELVVRPVTLLSLLLTWSYGSSISILPYTAIADDDAVEPVGGGCRRRDIHDAGVVVATVY